MLMPPRVRGSVASSAFAQVSFWWMKRTPLNDAFCHAQRLRSLAREVAGRRRHEGLAHLDGTGRVRDVDRVRAARLAGRLAERGQVGVVPERCHVGDPAGDARAGRVRDRGPTDESDVLALGGQAARDARVDVARTDALAGELLEVEAVLGMRGCATREQE